MVPPGSQAWIVEVFKNLNNIDILCQVNPVRFITGHYSPCGKEEEYFGHHPRVKSNRVYLEFQPIISSPAKAGTESKKMRTSKRIEIKSWFKDYCNSPYMFKNNLQ